MSIGDVVNLMRGAVVQVISMVGPVLGLALIVGLIVAIFQATTSIQEQTLTFVPKVLSIFATLILLGHWMLNNMVGYMEQLWADFSVYIR